MIYSINKKQNIGFSYKLPLFYYNCINQSTILYISWKELEIYLDNIITKIKKSNIKFDAIVGIKTGGAIISDYISKELELHNYKIKIVRKEYNNNKSEKHTLYDFYQKIILKNYGKYVITEQINDNLEGKNIILIDELINTGVTMYKAYKYLKKKKVNIVKSYCISFMNIDKKFNMSKCNLEYETTDHIMIWPWGYDN
jgi:phosphoribosylpyrophosphate synthetase